MPTIPLVRFLLALLDHQHQLDEQDRVKAEAQANSLGQKVRARRDELLSQGVVAAELDADILAAAEVDNEEGEEAAQRRGVLLVRRTSWNQALSLLWQRIRESISKEDGLAREYRLPDDQTDAESALRKYLCRVRLGAVEEPCPVSSELARLDAEGFGEVLLGHLRQQLSPDEVESIWDASPAPGDGSATAETPNPAQAPKGPQALPVQAPDWQGLLMMPPLSVAEIADALGEPLELVDRKLRYFRAQHDYGFIKDEDAGPTEEKYRYRMPDVLAHLQKWYAKRLKKRLQQP